MKARRNYSKDNNIEENRYTQNLCFKQTILLFYNRCIKRVDAARCRLNMNDIDICRTEDKSLVSLFLNGKCTANNPYLITHKLIGYKRGGKDCAVDETGKPIGITNTMDFKSVKDILFGTDAEIHSYLPALYLLIMNELPKYCKEYLSTWEFALFDYVPYAKYKTLLEIKIKYNISLKDAYGIPDEDVSNALLSIHQVIAINHLFQNDQFRQDFENAFLEFTKNQTSFMKIDEKFKNDFIINKYVPLLRKHAPKHETSLGLRVRDLLINDLSSVPNLLSDNVSEADRVIQYRLNIASSRYITDLENIQKLTRALLLQN